MRNVRRLSGSLSVQRGMSTVARLWRRGWAHRRQPATAAVQARTITSRRQTIPWAAFSTSPGRKGGGRRPRSSRPRRRRRPRLSAAPSMAIRPLAEGHLGRTSAPQVLEGSGDGRPTAPEGGPVTELEGVHGLEHSCAPTRRATRGPEMERTVTPGPESSYGDEGHGIMTSRDR